jgi:hypothetical protein
VEILVKPRRQPSPQPIIDIIDTDEEATVPSPVAQNAAPPAASQLDQDLLGLEADIAAALAHMQSSKETWDAAVQAADVEVSAERAAKVQYREAVRFHIRAIVENFGALQQSDGWSRLYD